jgi:hypothetical protein
MGIKDRIESLERQAGGGKEPKWLIYARQELSEAEEAEAVARYKVANPDWESREVNIVYVPSETL